MMLYRAAVIITLCSFAGSASANLISNPSFEQVPSGQMTQGILPTDWVLVNQTPDTYSNDGSFGLPPHAGGNFTGVTAHDGLRWVAAWAAANERFGQTLANPLTPGAPYALSAYMIQAVRPDLNSSGGYTLYLTADQTGNTATGALLGTIGFTSLPRAWARFTLNFTAPPNADSLPFLLLVPTAANGGGPYPGLDSLDLQLVPEPASLALLTLAIPAVARRRR